MRIQPQKYNYSSKSAVISQFLTDIFDSKLPVFRKYFFRLSFFFGLIAEKDIEKNHDTIHMSYVTIIVIENQCLRITRVHWREVANAIEAVKNRNGIWLDAGYVLIDKDSGMFVNAQSAVRMHKK